MLHRWFMLPTVCLLAMLAPLSPVGVVGVAQADVQGQLRQMIDSHDLRDTRVAVMVADLDTGRTLAQINAHEPMIPASNMKLITTATALDILGPDFLFRTELELVDTDAEAPTLVIRGDGDPAFADPVLLEAHSYDVEEVLEHWIEAVREVAEQRGLERFERLVVDDRVLDRNFVHPTWPEAQLNRSYAAEVAGINFYRNCIDIRLLPANRAGEAPSAEIYPDVPFIRTVNRARTGGDDAYWFSRARQSNRFTFHGSVRNRPWEPTQVTVHDPPMFFGRLLAHRLEEDAGLTIESVERPEDDQMLPAGRILHRIQTTLDAVLERINRDSQNMFAEAVLKRMGHAVTGAPGSWENGAAAVRLSLRQRLGPDSALTQVSDGSGFSRDNRTTAAILVNLLHSLHHDENAEKTRFFRRSLAVAGESGTLEDRMGDLDAVVFGKSGYLRGVSALSGYIVLEGEGGAERTLAFSFLFNGFEPPLYNHQMKQLQNRMVEAIVEATHNRVQLGG